MVVRLAVSTGTAGLALAVVLGGGVAAVASTSSGPPGAVLCTADGQPVLAARPDGSGGWVCGSGRTLRQVAGQGAVDALAASVSSLDARTTQAESDLRAAESALAGARARLSALEARTAVATVRYDGPFPWAVGPGGGTATTSPVLTCPGGKALSGSARASGATVTASHLGDDGASWQFTVARTSDAPAISLRVVCAGAGAGGTAPQPGVAPAR